MRLKSHESPRHQGRNHRGKGGSARKKQLHKRTRTLIRKLKARERSQHPDQGSDHSASSQVPPAGSSPAFFVPWS